MRLTPASLRELLLGGQQVTRLRACVRTSSSIRSMTRRYQQPPAAPGGVPLWRGRVEQPTAASSASPRRSVGSPQQRPSACGRCPGPCAPWRRRGSRTRLGEQHAARDVLWYQRVNSASSAYRSASRQSRMAWSVNQSWKTVPSPSTRAGMPASRTRSRRPAASRSPRARWRATSPGRRASPWSPRRRALHHVGVVGAGVGVAALGDKPMTSREPPRRRRGTAAEALGERGEVGHHAEPLLAAAAAEAEPGDDLVEDEQRAVLLVSARSSSR